MDHSIVCPGWNPGKLLLGLVCRSIRATLVDLFKYYRCDDFDQYFRIGNQLRHCYLGSSSLGLFKR